MDGWIDGGNRGEGKGERKGASGDDSYCSTPFLGRDTDLIETLLFSFSLIFALMNLRG